MCAIRAHNSPTRLADVMAMRKATFTEKCNNEQVARGSDGLPMRLQSTRLRSHMGEGLLVWCVFYAFKEVFNHGISEDSDSVHLAMKESMAERCTLSEMVDRPNF